MFAHERTDGDTFLPRQNFGAANQPSIEP
jgi:hypothetical protein